MRSSTALASAAMLAACSSAGVTSVDERPEPTPSSASDASVTDAPSPMGDDASSPAATLGSEPSWDDGTECTKDIETWALDASTFVLRQSLCTHFEAPFMLLFVGDERALLVDSGTGDADVGAAVDAVLAGRDVDLVVSHSHAHGDHVGGDAALAKRPRTRVVGKSVSAVNAEYGFDGSGAARSVDLGGRTIDVLPTPGHEAAHVAFYDRRTRILSTGDTLYPGRLYVRDFVAYKASIARLVGFVDAAHPVSLVLGAHVELTKGGDEFPAGADTHPNEHALSLAESDLRDLHAAVQKMTAAARVEGPRWIIVPVQ